MSTTELPAADGSSPKRQKFDSEPAMCIDPQKRYTAEMVTSKGSMSIALDPLAAPRTVNNFVFLARYHYFDGIVFHRVIPGFVLQGGNPTGTGRGGPGYQFADELPQPGRYELGSLAMANAGPGTNGSQFLRHLGSRRDPSPTELLPVRQGGLRPGNSRRDRRPGHTLRQAHPSRHDRVRHHRRSRLGLERSPSRAAGPT